MKVTSTPAPWQPLADEDPLLAEAVESVTNRATTSHRVHTKGETYRAHYDRLTCDDMRDLLAFDLAGHHVTVEQGRHTITVTIETPTTD